MGTLKTCLRRSPYLPLSESAVDDLKTHKYIYDLIGQNKKKEK